VKTTIRVSHVPFLNRWQNRSQNHDTKYNSITTFHCKQIRALVNRPINLSAAKPEHFTHGKDQQLSADNKQHPGAGPMGHVSRRQHLPFPSETRCTRCRHP